MDTFQYCTFCYLLELVLMFVLNTDVDVDVGAGTGTGAVIGSMMLCISIAAQFNKF